MPLPFAFAGLRSFRFRQARFFSHVGSLLGRVRSWLGDRLLKTEGQRARSPQEPRSAHLEVGRRGEIAAAAHLEALGYRVLFRNIRIAGGELDIIALHEKTVVFVEVKSRLGESAAAWERVDEKKRRFLLRAARAFARQRNLQGFSQRFDVVTVCWPSHDTADAPVVRVYRNAFSEVRET